MFLDFSSLHDDDTMGGPPPHLRGLVEREREQQIRAMQAAHQAMEHAKKRMDEAVRAASQPQQQPLPLTNKVTARSKLSPQLKTFV